MELIVNIDEETYKDIKKGKVYSSFRDVPQESVLAIANGTLLPKGHGRLIILSEDEVKREQVPLNFSCQNWISEVGLLNATVAIIEADTESEGTDADS